jgi:hypothetical protein
MTRTGRILIAAGAAVWVVFGIVWLAGGNPQVSHWVPFHLAGVIPGAVLARWGWLRARFGTDAS